MKIKDTKHYCVVLNLNSMYSILRDFEEVEEGTKIEDFQRQYYISHTSLDGDEFHICVGKREIRKIIREGEKRSLKRECINTTKSRIKRLNLSSFLDNRNTLKRDVYYECKTVCDLKGIPLIIYDEIWEQACQEVNNELKEKIRRFH